MHQDQGVSVVGASTAADSVSWESDLRWDLGGMSMKAAKEYRNGEVYFRIAFPDSKRHYPKIESFVFVGKNLSDEDTGDAWYFQFADGFARHGSILATDEGDRRVVILPEKDLPDMLDLGHLVAELEAAALRRRTAEP